MNCAEVTTPSTLSPLTCWHCNATFQSRNKLYQHCRSCVAAPNTGANHSGGERKCSSFVQALLVGYTSDGAAAEGILIEAFAATHTQVETVTRSSRPQEEHNAVCAPDPDPDRRPQDLVASAEVMWSRVVILSVTLNHDYNRKRICNCSLNMKRPSSSLLTFTLGLDALEQVGIGFVRFTDS